MKSNTYSLRFSILLRSCEEVTVTTMPSLEDEAVRVAEQVVNRHVACQTNGIVKCLKHHEGDIDLRHEAVATQSTESRLP
jgi:hypothetical protein